MRKIESLLPPEFASEEESERGGHNQDIMCVYDMEYFCCIRFWHARGVVSALRHPAHLRTARTHAESTCVQEAQVKEHSCILLEEDISLIPTRNKPQARNYLLITAPTIDHGSYFLSDVDFFLLL